jgi:hypothetical protein
LSHFFIQQMPEHIDIKKNNKQLSSFLICVWAYFTMMAIANPLEAWNVTPYVWPGTLLLLLLSLVLNPFPVLLKRSRLWFIHTMVIRFVFFCEQDWFVIKNGQDRDGS